MCEGAGGARPLRTPVPGSRLKRPLALAREGVQVRRTPGVTTREWCLVGRPGAAGGDVAFVSSSG